MSEKINNVHKILNYPFIVFHLQTHAENLLNEGGKTRSTYKITFDMHKFHSFYHEDHHYRVPKKIGYINRIYHIKYSYPNSVLYFHKEGW